MVHPNIHIRELILEEDAFQNFIYYKLAWNTPFKHSNNTLVGIQYVYIYIYIYIYIYMNKFYQKHKVHFSIFFCIRTRLRKFG